MSQEFRAKTSFKVALILFTAFFLALLIASCAVIVRELHRQVPNWTLFIFTSAIWIAMLAICAYGIRDLARRFLVHDDGFDVLTRARREEYRWSDIEFREYTTSAESGYRLGFRDGRRVELSFHQLKDGPQFRESIDRALEQHLCADAKALIGREFRNKERKFTLLVFGFTFVFMFSLLLAGQTRSTGRPPTEPLILILLVLMPIGLMGVYVATQRARLDSDALELASIFGKKKIPYDSVREIAFDAHVGRGGMIETMALHGDGWKIGVSTVFERYPDLRDALVTLCPQAQVRDRRRSSSR